MLNFVLLLLAIWIIISIIGFIVRGLLWLALIGIILFAVTSIWAAIRRPTNRR